MRRFLISAALCLASIDAWAGGGAFLALDPTTDPDAQDYFQRAEALGGSFDLSGTNATATESYVKAGHNELVRVLKGETATVFVGTSQMGGDSFGTQPTPINVWDKITELYMLYGVTFAGLPAKLKYDSVASLTLNNVVSGDLVTVGAGAGLVGDGLGKDIATGFLNSSLTGNDRSFGAYIVSTGTNNTAIFTPDSSWGIYQVSGITHRVPSSDAEITLTNTVALYVSSRRGVNDVEVYANGTSVATDTATASATTSANEWRIFSRGGGIYWDGRLASSHIGLGLTTTEAVYFSWSINAHATYFDANTFVNP